jgi:hypothetical protein
MGSVLPETPRAFLDPVLSSSPKSIHEVIDKLRIGTREKWVLFFEGDRGVRGDE